MQPDSSAADTEGRPCLLMKDENTSTKRVVADAAPLADGEVATSATISSTGMDEMFAAGTPLHPTNIVNQNVSLSDYRAQYQLERREI